MKITTFSTVALLLVSPPVLASQETSILNTIHGIATAADAQDWDTLERKFSDHVVLNQLSLEQRDGARVTEQTVIDTWAELLPRFDRTFHRIDNVTITASSSVVAQATARYHTTYHLGARTWEQTGQLTYVLKSSADGWRVTALNTTPEWENQPISAVLCSDNS